MVMEFGLWWVQEFDVVLWGIWVVYIGGFDFISNVWVGKFFGILIFGIYVYVLVQIYWDEYEVFKVYVEIYYDCIFLVDIFDILCFGVLNVIWVVKEFGDWINFQGIWIDFGDMVYLFKKVWKMLDEVGFKDVKIVCFNGFDEKII